MSARVAQITSAIKQQLDLDPIWEYEFLEDKDGNIVMDLEDAVEVLDKRDFIEIDWQPLEIGSPLPARRRKR